MSTLLFRYLAARWRYPGPAAKRFIQAGLGLERRSRHLSAFWNDHLSRARAAQTRWAQTSQGDLLTVLGAGPLYDFNAHALGRAYKHFRLVDANPLAPTHWTRLATPTEPVVTDISCCVEAWSNTIARAHSNWNDTLALIRQVGASAVPAYSPPTDGLISLNILSQLEVTWQDSIEAILKRRFGRAFVRKHEQAWLDAIQPGSQTVAEQHLHSLASSQAQNILLIADLEYVEYTGRKYIRTHAAPPPVRYTETGWEADDGIRCEITPALEGVELNASTFARWLPAYELEWHDHWLWHIAPNGTETERYGKLHRVGAFAFRRKF